MNMVGLKKCSILFLKMMQSPKSFRKTQVGFDLFDFEQIRCNVVQRVDYRVRLAQIMAALLITWASGKITLSQFQFPYL